MAVISFSPMVRPFRSDGGLFALSRNNASENRTQTATASIVHPAQVWARAKTNSNKTSRDAHIAWSVTRWLYDSYNIGISESIGA